MNAYRCIVVIFILLLFLSPGAFAKKLEYLYIQSSNEASLLRDAKKNIYHLTLTPAEPWVLYFSEAPKRISGILPIQKFMNAVTENKGVNMGMVGLVKNQKGSSKLSHAFTILDSHYNMSKNVVQYKLKSLQTSHIYSPLKFKFVALFIDACTSCGGGNFFRP